MYCYCAIVKSICILCFRDKSMRLQLVHVITAGSLNYSTVQSKTVTIYRLGLNQHDQVKVISIHGKDPQEDYYT